MNKLFGTLVVGAVAGLAVANQAQASKAAKGEKAHTTGCVAQKCSHEKHAAEGGIACTNSCAGQACVEAATKEDCAKAGSNFVWNEAKADAKAKK